MNARAFNLFTALVAVIMIVLTGVLTQSMVQTENNTQSILTDIQEQSRIESVAELTRTDTVQIFNFVLRKSLQDYLTASPFTPIERLDEWNDWEGIKAKFVGDVFGRDGADAFATSTARYLRGLYDGFGLSFETYEITVENTENFEIAMKEIMAASINPGTGGKFFEVIHCDDPNDVENCIGTFYINLKTSQVEREKLPRIKIEDKTTGRILKDSILPANDVRIYVPLRVFKALALTRKIALDSVINARTNIGGAGFGMCPDASGTVSCNSLKVWNTPQPVSTSVICPVAGLGGTNETNLLHNNGRPEEVGISGTPLILFDPYDETNYTRALQESIERVVCQNIQMSAGQLLTANEVTKFGLIDSVQNNIANDCGSFDLEVGSAYQSEPTAHIQLQGQLASISGGETNGKCFFPGRVIVNVKTWEKDPTYVVDQSALYKQPNDPGASVYQFRIVDSSYEQTPLVSVSFISIPCDTEYSAIGNSASCEPGP